MGFSELLTLFNLQTTTLLIGIAVMIQAVLIMIQSVMIKEYRGIRTAAFGNFCFGFGTILTSFRDIISDFAAIILSNYLIIIGALLLYVAICRFLSERPSMYVIALSMIPVLVLFPFFTLVKNDLSMRVVVIGFSGCILTGAISMRLLRVGQVNFRFSAYFLAAVSGVNALVLLIRGIGMVFYPSQHLLSPNPVIILHSLAMFIATFLWSVGFFLMVSHRLQGDLNELATIDSLTRILNRRAMTMLIEAEFSRLDRANVDFSILLVDMDHFKAINDNFGHEVGDRVLHTVAQLLRRFLRMQDFICRWGGEEFMILLPAATLHEAVEIGERLRSAIENEKFSFDHHEVSLTVSIGVESSVTSKTMDSIYKSADMALYKAKLSRNAVESHELVLA